MGTGKGWSTEETVSACIAYVSASEDPRSGNGKKRDLFVSQILAIYVKKMDDVRCKQPLVSYPERTGEAISQRYRKARCECIKFEGLILSVKAREPTGSPSEEDIERAALAVYNGEVNISNMYTYLRDSTVDVGVDFLFRDALIFLRETHTWHYVLLSRQRKKILLAP